MASTPISALPAAATLTGTEMIPVVQGGDTVRTTVAAAVTALDVPRAQRPDLDRHNVKDYGAVGNGVTDDVTAIQATIDACWAAGGGEVFFPPGTYVITATIVLPRGFNTKSLRLIGAGAYTSQISSGTALDSSTPLLRWHASVGAGVNNQAIGLLRFTRSNGGPVIDHTPIVFGDRCRLHFFDLQLDQLGSGSGTLLRIEGSLQSVFDRLLFRGGYNNGLAFHLIGSGDHVNRPYYPDNAGRFMFFDGGGGHVVTLARSESSNLATAVDYCYKFLNCSNSVIIQPRTEGAYEQTMYHVEGCQRLIFIDPEVATAEDATNPDGFKFINSDFCQIHGGDGGRFTDEGTGKLIGFDANSACNIVRGLTILSGSATNWADANGTNDVTIIETGGTPPSTKTYGKHYAPTFLTNGSASPRIGSEDNATVLFVQNNVEVFRLSGSAMTMNGGMTLGGTTFLNGGNVTFGTTTGTKFGTSAAQKIGFYNATPVVQPSGTPAAATDPATTMALANDLRTKLLALGLIG